MVESGMLGDRPVEGRLIGEIMRWIGGSVLIVVFGSLAGACGTAPDGADEHVSQVAEGITAACSTDTLGLPCDPDGPAGSKLECEGACSLNQAGLVVCAAVTTPGRMDGVVCGTTNGVGDNACKRYCSGKTCLLADAPSGTACRPTSKSNPCEGQCNGAGKCEQLGGSACDFGRNEQLCKFATCNFTNATECVVKNLGKNTRCSDTDACSIGLCDNSGACVAGPTIGCDDGNACTDDSCDPMDGGCVGVKDDSNACSDGNACFTGEQCVSGACVAGTTPVDCDDNNECTSDVCDPNTGCGHLAKSCSDGNACTQDVCDPIDGSCSHPELACDDANLCTNDSCDGATGCVFAPINCDDANACTADSCSAGNCSHDSISCDDSDPCTADSCDVGNGCAHAAIADCGGAGGAGGEPANGGAGGEPETGGAGGEPVAGTGGVGDGGEPTTNGGEPTTGGTPGQGGSVTAGSSGAAVSGSDSGGSNGGVAGGSAAGTATAGSASDGGVGGSAVSPDSPDTSSGCGCRTAGTPAPSGLGLSALVLAGVALLRRRRAA
jgi:MYXO-CTERM domain-containing protein